MSITILFKGIKTTPINQEANAIYNYKIYNYGDIIITIYGFIFF